MWSTSSPCFPAQSITYCIIVIMLILSSSKGKGRIPKGPCALSGSQTKHITIFSFDIVKDVATILGLGLRQTSVIFMIVNSGSMRGAHFQSTTND